MNKANNSKFVTRKWNIANDQSYENYDVGNEIIHNTEVLKPNLCDYNDAYILVKSDITVAAAPATQVSFKNYAPFTKCITKIDGTTIDDAENLDLVMPMYNLIQYSSNYSETTGNLWLHSKNERTNFNADITDTNDFKSLKFKAKLLGNRVAQPNPNHANGIATIAIPLKYLSNFWRSLEMPLINWNVELRLKWKKYCVLSVGGDENLNDNNNANNIIFIIKDTKLYVSVVILSVRDNQKLSELLSKGFARSVYWNKI